MVINLRERGWGDMGGAGEGKGRNGVNIVYSSNKSSNLKTMGK